MIYPQSVVYALESLAYISSLPQDSSIKAKELAKTLGIPEHFLGKILTVLAKKKLITSSKGPTGGFQLPVNVRNYSVYRILVMLDGLTALEENCVMGLKECTSESPCALHDLWLKFKNDAVARTQQLTLIDLSKTIEAKNIFSHK